MSRLRPLRIGTDTLPDGTTRDRTILVLDNLTPEQVLSVREGRPARPPAGIPRILAFADSVDLPDQEATIEYTTETQAPGKQTILVFGRSSYDTLPLADQLQQVAGEGVKVVSVAATRHHPGLPLGLYKPVIVRTPDYMKLDDDHEGKKTLEDQARQVLAKP